MGWCGSPTRVFDAVAKFVLETSEDDAKKTEVLRTLAVALEEEDWDCQFDSDYANHPLVDAIFRELHPTWFDEDEYDG